MVCLDEGEEEERKEQGLEKENYVKHKRRRERGKSVRLG